MVNSFINIYRQFWVEFACWISFAAVFQFYVLLSPYLCFISILYLDLYVFGDDALIS